MNVKLYINESNNNVLNKNNTEIIDYDRQILDDYAEKYNAHPEFNSNLINNSVKYINEVDDYNNKLYQMRAPVSSKKRSFEIFFCF